MAFRADRSPRGVVMVSGADAQSFLQNLVSQDLDPVGQGEGVHTLVLHPQGKVDIDLRALHLDGAYDAAHAGTWALDCEAAYGPRLAASLERFRIRVDVDLRDVSESAGLVSVVGVEDAAAVGLADELGSTVHSHRAARETPGVRVVRAEWGGHRGFDLLGPRDAVLAVAARLPAEIAPVGPEVFEAFRIEAGVPRLGADVDDSTIPQEAFLERDAVSFTKGCFVGQELVCRIDTRGHVNRFLRRIRLDGDAPPSGAAVVLDDREVGTVTSAAAVPDEDRSVALAMVRREVEPPAEVHLRWDGATRPARVEAL